MRKFRISIHDCLATQRSTPEMRIPHRESVTHAGYYALLAVQDGGYTHVKTYI
jgi:hypothetical protein